MAFMGSYLLNQKKQREKKREKHDKEKISPFFLPPCCLMKLSKKILG
jgi:hypothetical protein